MTSALGDSIHVLSGCPFNSGAFNTNSGMPLIRIRDLLRGATETFFRGTFDHAYIVRAGDVLIGMDGDFHVVRWPGPDALLNQRVCRITSRSGGLDAGFLYWWLQPAVAQVHRRTPETTVRHLSVGDLYGIPRPSLVVDAQKYVAQVLDRIEGLIERTETEIAKLRQVRWGLLHDLVTEGITISRDVPLVSMAAIRFSSVDKLSEHGERPVRLCNYTDVYKNTYILSDMPFMRATASTAEVARFGLRVGDVIITKDSETPDDIGVPVVVDSTAPDLVCGYHLALIRPDLKSLDPLFLAMQLKHTRLARYCGRQASG
ncbi:MAG: restriction endonuclease subunit S, partial [bacterium]